MGMVFGGNLANSRKDADAAVKFYCGALSFDSYGTQSYVLKQKGPRCVILKPQTSLESESFLALFDPDASRLLTRSCHLQFIAYANLFHAISQQ